MMGNDEKKEIMEIVNNGLVKLATAINQLKDGKEIITMNHLYGVRNIYSNLLQKLQLQLKEDSEKNKNN